MVDVGRYHCAARSHFLAYKFRCDVCGNAQSLTIHVLADGHIFHFRGNHSLTGHGQLRNVCARFGSQRQVVVCKPKVVQALVRQSFAAVSRGKLG